MNVIETAPLTTAAREFPGEDRRTHDVGVGWAILAGAAALAMVIFRVWVLARSGTPAGIDTGNWLAYGNGLLGNNVKAGGLVYPPLVPLLVALAVKALGPTNGIAVIGAVAASMPAVGVFLVLRWSGLGSWAAVLAVFMLPQPALGDIAAWGGYPQLAAAPLLVVALWWLARWLEVGDRRAIVGAAIAGALLLATSHFVALFGAIGAGVVVLHQFLIPIYVRLVPAVFGARDVGFASASIAPTRVFDRFVAIHGVVTPFLIVGIACALICVVVPPHDARDRRLSNVNEAIVIGILSTFLLTHEPRVLYEAPLIASIGVGTTVLRFKSRLTGTRRAWVRRGAPVAASICAGVALLLATLSGVGRFEAQQRKYAILNGDLIASLNWLRVQTPRTSVIGVTDIDSAPLGWWVEGLGERRTIMECPSQWLIFPEERRSSVQASHVFHAFERDVQLGFDEARRLGINYLVIPRRSPTYELSRLELHTDRVRPSFQNDGVVVLRVPEPPP